MANDDNLYSAIADALQVILKNFVPTETITDDSMTTAELSEMVQEHIGVTNSQIIYVIMKAEGYNYKFSFARKELVWMMEFDD